MNTNHIPVAFYDASGCLHALRGLTKALQYFSDMPGNGTPDREGFETIAGLLDAQADTVAKLSTFIEATEASLLKMGIAP